MRIRRAAPTPTPVQRFGFLDTPEGRRLRARRILHAFADFGQVDVPRARILDVGCSAGLMTEEMATSASQVIGVDVDSEAIGLASGRGGARYVVATADELPFADASFDAVVCNHIYEHVPDARAMMSELHRVMRADSACYFACGHTLQLVEPHYRQPFLSWVPRRCASFWVRSLGLGASYDVHFVAPWRLRSLFERFSAVEMISPAMLREPVRYGFPDLARMPRVVRRGVAVASKAIALLAPTWIFMLRR